ncbi:MAG: chemotaxis protein CheW [Methyloligellaceae bacterium]
MDDLLSEFLTETAESLDVVDAELVKFEQEPNNTEILSNIFRLVHTVKGTCGFLGLPRLETLAHAAENLMGQYRDGSPVNPEGVTLILHSIDRIKEILIELEQHGTEPEGDDQDLISKLDKISLASENGPTEVPSAASEMDEPAIDVPELQRELKPGEVSLEELERAFQEAPGPDDDLADDSPPADNFPTDNVPTEKQDNTAGTAEPGADKPQQNTKRSAREKPANGKTGGGEGPVKSQTIRVNVDTLEQLMTMVSELVLTRNQLLEIDRRQEESQFKVPLQRLSNVTAELQEGVMKTRMQPVGNAWQKLPRIIRDLSQELDKKINLEMIGADTELDRQVLEQIKDPLTHMVRNSADHGLETTEERIRVGKPEEGNITLRAYHDGGHIIIEIADDGKGLNTEKIRQKVLESEFTTEDELNQMSEQELHKLIFNAGLSTAKEVTSVSGRGVGMDVVRTNIELIGGTVDLKSVQGEGTVFMIKIPLTLAIVSALIVEASGQRFAIPQLSVIELVRAHKSGEHRIESINDTPLLRLRNQLMPIVYLRDILGLESDVKKDAEADAENKANDDLDFVIVTQVGRLTFGIVVDSVFHTEEIVVKPMSSKLRDVTMFSGNTILGDGSVIMIVDPNGISQCVVETRAGSGMVDESELKSVYSAQDDATTMLVFKAGSDEPKAVPLSLVTRLEDVEAGTIEKSNGRYLVQYRGSLMPLVFMDEAENRKESGRQPVLVFTDGQRVMGLVVDEIVDIVDEVLKVEVSSTRPDRLGSAVIKGVATEIIDVAHYLPKAFDDWLEIHDNVETVKELNVLLVDDSAFFRNMLAPLLSAAGYRVTLADSATTAMDLLNTDDQFDIIISDIEMPEMDGIAFAEALKRDQKWASTPIIALSSHSTKDMIDRSRAVGFLDYVAKFDREGLLETLKDCKSTLVEAA